MYENLVDALRRGLGALLEGRFSAFGATLLVYALFAALRAVGYLATNRDKVRKAEAEVRSWEERRRKAVEARDTKLYERVLREKSRVDRLKRDLEAERIKASIATFAAWLVCFKVLWDAVGGLPVVNVPLPWGYEKTPFAAWFLINSFWAGVLLDRLTSAVKHLLKNR